MSISQLQHKSLRYTAAWGKVRGPQRYAKDREPSRLSPIRGCIVYHVIEQQTNVELIVTYGRTEPSSQPSSFVDFGTKANVRLDDLAEGLGKRLSFNWLNKREEVSAGHTSGCQ